MEQKRQRGCQRREIRYQDACYYIATFSNFRLEIRVHTKYHQCREKSEKKILNDENRERIYYDIRR